MTKSRALKILLSLVIFALLFYLVDFSEMWASLSKLTPIVVFYLMMVSALLLYVSALKWSYFIEALGSQVSVFKLFSLYLLGYFVNLIAPSYIGGDAARSWLIGKKVGQHQALTATILERYTGLVAMLSLGVVFIWVVDLVTWPIRLAVLVAAIGLATVTMIALSPKSLHFVEKFKPLKGIVKHLHKIQDGFRLAKKDRVLIVKALALSFVYHSFTVVNVITAAAAIGWFNPPIDELFVVLPLILLISAIPLSPNSLGLQEGAYYYFLTGIGATPTQAIVIALVLRAKTYVLAIFGGIVWLSLGMGKEIEQKGMKKPLSDTKSSNTAGA